MNKFFLIPFLFATLAQAQWVKVANEGQTVIFGSTPIIVRFGTPQGTPVTTPDAIPCATVGGCWDDPLSITAGPPVTLVVSLANFKGFDPARGTLKELDVQQTTVLQTVTVDGKVVPIPASGPPPPPPIPVKAWSCTVPTGGSLVFTIYSDGSNGVSGNYQCKETL